MSLRWSSYVDPKSPKGGSKTQNGRFPSKIALLLKKVFYKVSLCENCQRHSCRAFIGLTIHAKIIGGDVPFYRKFWVKLTRWSEIADFLSIFARSTSGVTSSEKSSIITNRKSFARFPMIPRWTSYVVPNPQRVAEKRKVSKIWTIVLILRFSRNSIALLAKYVTVVEYRPIMSVNVVSQFQYSTFGQN